MQLFREVGLLAATLLVIGNIIGIGIFTTSGLIAAEVGNSTWLLGVWLIGGMLALIGAICYSVLAVRTPQAGGEYVFLYTSYGPLTAFLSGWASLIIGFSAPIAASALGLVIYLRPFLPDSVSQSTLLQKCLAALTIIIISWLLSWGLQFGNRLHGIITLFNLALTFGFALTVLWLAPVSENLEPILTGISAPVSLPSLGQAIVLVMFSYSGWNAAAYIAEEIRRPSRYIPWALLLGTGTVIIAYLLMNLAYFGAVPLSQLQGEIAVAEITARTIFPTQASTFVTTLILFSILSSITAMSIAGPRVYFAMSRNRLLPSWLSEIDEKRRIPMKSIFFQAAVAISLVAFGTFREILLFAGVILMLFSTLTVSVLLRIPRGAINSVQFWSLYRLLPGIFVLINSSVLINVAFGSPRETAAGFLTLMAGLPLYFLYRHQEKTGS
ncbi:MAG: amino acid permease [Acidobacteriota bacterium]|nr:amino acid permease [Acidobacteriota bacterium]